jgi:phosphomevalonate kinase
VSLCTLSEPLKQEYARLNGLQMDELMSDGKAKELVRKEMIIFGEEMRNIDSGVFCRFSLFL